MKVPQMKNKIPFKLFTLIAFTGELFAKNMPTEFSSSFLKLPTTEAVNSFMLTPMELITPVSFDANIFVDFSIGVNIFWF
jgi:hypothetical protein